MQSTNSRQWLTARTPSDGSPPTIDVHHGKVNLGRGVSSLRRLPEPRECFFRTVIWANRQDGCNSHLVLFKGLAPQRHLVNHLAVATLASAPTQCETTARLHCSVAGFGVTTEVDPAFTSLSTRNVYR